MPKDNFKDFDDFFAESRAAKAEHRPSFKLGGREFLLPPALPASIPIRAMRLLAEHGATANVPGAEAMELATEIFGTEQLDQLLATGIDVEELGEIIKWALAAYNPGAAEGNPEAPEGAEKSISSETGH